MKLKYQLFVVLLVASALLIALMLAVNNVSFQHQFINYVNSVEQKRLETFIAELSTTYESEGSWRWINRGAWGVLMRKHNVQKRPGMLHPNGPPRSLAKRKSSPPRGTSERPNPKEKKKARLPWLTLLDDERQYVIGRRQDHDAMQWLPITYSGGTAGYLGLIPHKQLSQLLDRQFVRQQRRNFLYAALAMVLLSALIAAPLASRLIRPLSDVNCSISALSSGDYDYRTTTTVLTNLATWHRTSIRWAKLCSRTSWPDSAGLQKYRTSCGHRSRCCKAK
jgi:two-component system sensor histidine kinase BaeS